LIEFLAPEGNLRSYPVQFEPPPALIWLLIFMIRFLLGLSAHLVLPEMLEEVSAKC
jgi:hypothetical protein